MLHNEVELRQYLLTDGTCKCGLECPLIVTRVFNFDPKVPFRSRTVQEAMSDGALTKLCNHKRKVVAMAVLEDSGVDMRRPSAATPNASPHGCVVHGGGTHLPPDTIPPVMTPKAASKPGIYEIDNLYDLLDKKNMHGRNVEFGNLIMCCFWREMYHL